MNHIHLRKFSALLTYNNIRLYFHDLAISIYIIFISSNIILHIINTKIIVCSNTNVIIMKQIIPKFHNIKYEMQLYFTCVWTMTMKTIYLTINEQISIYNLIYNIILYKFLVWRPFIKTY